MSTLHILYASKWPSALERLWSPGDDLLLAGASVALALASDSPLQQFMQRTDATIMALDDAVHCRGLHAHWPQHITLIDSAAWIAAVITHPKSLSWA